MKADDKIYMNQIWHKIHLEESKLSIKKEHSIKGTIKKLSLTILIVLFISALLLAPELLQGYSAPTGLIILSSITFSEYKKLKGDSYDF